VSLAADGILMQCFEPDALDTLMRAWDGGYRELLAWWRDRLPADMLKRAQFPLNVAEKRGPRALAEEPKVIVGTIHSVKGGQADVVYLFPDLSQAADAHYARGGAARDTVVRLFYVGITRARESVVLCQRESALAVSL
jgi:superfamily I DNA/RNA helicase